MADYKVHIEDENAKGRPLCKINTFFTQDDKDRLLKTRTAVLEVKLDELCKRCKKMWEFENEVNIQEIQDRQAKA